MAKIFLNVLKNHQSTHPGNSMNPSRINTKKSINRLIIVKMSISPKSLYKISEIPIKIPAGFFGGYRQNHSKLYKERQRNSNS